MVVNHTFHDRRRADVSLRLPASADAAVVIERLRARLAEDPRVLKDPAPILELTGLGEAWAELSVRPWTEREDHGRVKADVLLWAKLLEKDLDAALPATPEIHGDRPHEERRPKPALA